MLDLTIECSYSCRTRCRKTYTNFYNIRLCIFIDRNSDRRRGVATPTAGHFGLWTSRFQKKIQQQISPQLRLDPLHFTYQSWSLRYVQTHSNPELRNTSIAKSGCSTTEDGYVNRLVFPVRFSRLLKKTFRTGRWEKCRARPSPVRHWVSDVGIFGCEPEKVGSNSHVVNQWFQNWNWIEEHHRDDIKISAIWRGNRKARRSPRENVMKYQHVVVYSALVWWRGRYLFNSWLKKTSKFAKI